MDCPFSKEDWKDKIVHFTKAQNLMESMSKEAIQDSRSFEIDYIYQSWMNHLKKLTGNE